MISTKYLPLLLLPVWIGTVGCFIWIKAHQSQQILLPDPVSYMQKAKNSWENADKGFPKNPLNVEPSLRPPGTVLISYPFGYDGDIRAFNFRSIFIPFLIWTFAVLLLLWPSEGVKKTSDAWLITWACILLGTNPFFLNLEGKLAGYCRWGMMDQSLGAISGLAMAFVIKSIEKRTINLLAVGVCLASFAVFIKPVGSMTLLAIGAYFFFSQGAYIYKNLQDGSPYKMRFGIIGLSLFALIGGGTSAICLRSEYISQYNIESMQEAVNYLSYGEKDIVLALKKLYGFCGVQGIALISLTTYLLLRDYIKREWRLHSIEGIACALIFGFGFWLISEKLVIQQIRYYSPFAYMGIALLIYWLKQRMQYSVADRHFASWVKRTIIPIGMAYACMVIGCFSFDMADKKLQYALAIDVDISKTESDEMKIVKWIQKTYQGSKNPPKLYPMVFSTGTKDRPNQTLVCMSRNNLSMIDPEARTYDLAYSHLWQGEPTLYLSDIVWDADIIVMNDVESKFNYTESHNQLPFKELVEIRSFMADLIRLGKLTIAYREGGLVVVKIPDKELFLRDFDSAFAYKNWNKAFIMANGIKYGKVHLLDTFATIIPSPKLISANSQTIGSFDACNGITPVPDSIICGRILRVSGWLADNPLKGITADSILLTLKCQDGTTYFSRTEKVRRPDLVRGYGHSSLLNSGFEAELDTNNLKGNYELGLSFLKDGKWYTLNSSTRYISLNE